MDLKEKGVTKCQNVVIQMKDGKKTTYYLGKNKFSDEAHKGLGLCTATKDEPVQIEVTGTWEKKPLQGHPDPHRKDQKDRLSDDNHLMSTTAALRPISAMMGLFL